MLPASIAVAAICMPLMNPRQALPTSKLRQLVRQVETMVHRTGDRRLEMVLAHRRGDEHADALGVDARCVDRRPPGHGRGLVELHALRPPAPRLDAGQLRERAGLQAGALVRLGELLIDPAAT